MFYYGLLEFYISFDIGYGFTWKINSQIRF